MSNLFAKINGDFSFAIMIFFYLIFYFIIFSILVIINWLQVITSGFRYVGF